MTVLYRKVNLKHTIEQANDVYVNFYQQTHRFDIIGADMEQMIQYFYSGNNVHKKKLLEETLAINETAFRGETKSLFYIQERQQTLHYALASISPTYDANNKINGALLSCNGLDDPCLNVVRYFLNQPTIYVSPHTLGVAERHKLTMPNRYHFTQREKR